MKPSNTGNSKSSIRGLDVRSEFLERIRNGENVAPAAVRILSKVVEMSRAGTMMGLEEEINMATQELKDTLGTTSIALQAACELFFRFVTRVTLDSKTFEESKLELMARGQAFVKSTEGSVQTIALSAERFVNEGCSVLTHGNSKLVSAILKKAAETKTFKVYVTECRPKADGFRVAERLLDSKIPCTVILDSAVGAIMEKVDMVLVGAEGVMENGGLVNKVGTFQLALAAKAFNKPFYVAAESFKFARVYPLGQNELVVGPKRDPGIPWEPQVPNVSIPEGVSFETVLSDFTPSSYITLLFSDLGVLTTAAVSDELIQLYG